MYFERLYDEGLAEASYIIACQRTGDAIVVDPLPDLDRYLDRVQSLGYRIAGVAETHIHADFLSGGRDLARATGAVLYISGEEAAGWEYGGLEGLETVALKDGETIELGGVIIKALHTPGHTPEHLSYLVIDTAQSEEPMMLLSGDFAFVGDLGRPDLLEKAAGQSGTAQTGARQLFESVRDKLLRLDDSVQIWPNHGAGSACGKSLGAIPSSTVGYERRNAWWSNYLATDDVDGFVEELLADQPESPNYFRNMKEMNRDGIPGGHSLPALARLTPAGFEAAREEGALVLDVRGAEAFAAGHLAQAINLPSLQGISTHAGWVVPYDRQLVIISDEEELDEVTRRLYRIGFRNFGGYIPGLEGYGGKLVSHDHLDAEQAREALAAGAAILDVRSASEYAEGHIQNAYHGHYGRLDAVVDELPRDKDILVYCGSGIRASVAISVLAAQGFDNLKNAGGFEALQAAGLAVAS